MKRKRIASVDQDTGEVLDGVIVYCGVKHNPYAKGWVMNSQDALELLAKDKDLTGETLRVLMFLMARLDFENWIQITVTEIGKELELKQPNVSRAILLLEEKGIILRGPKVGRSYAFRLNPYYGWKGKVRNLNDYRNKEDDQQRRETLKNHLKAVKTPPQTDD
ncbi:helix-turn-helix domain-containing protein [Chroococcus sp. FPU101]|uniref:MarR family transcriptional regulator n=1 Tax=Chroococcus sp. FPU101 TaxID=1974212 RepID=UPI001A8E1AE8|nr:helix-turn-helix domain-containing protein [Chroococcus sp. FPU101]GFE72237.1 hypothetical protein CFPU101_48470 [Chroococcus sp. FPU101]